MTKNKDKKTDCFFKRKIIDITHDDHFLNTGITLGHILLVFIILGLAMWFIITSFTTTRVDGHSMDPTLDNENFLLIQKYRLWDTPDRGEIISSLLDEEHNNTPGGVTVVKRVIGLPGEIVEFKNRRFSVINPETGYIKFREDYLIDPQLTPSWEGELKRFIVPGGEYFVLGDNREISEDSRDYGTILEENIIGKVIAKIPSVFMIKDVEYDYKYKTLDSVVQEKLLEIKEDEEKLNNENLLIDSELEEFLNDEEYLIPAFEEIIENISEIDKGIAANSVGEGGVLDNLEL